MATGGLYRFVRHPGYLDAVVVALATPLLLGSPWAFTPAAGAAVMYAVRTFPEDRTLMNELAGDAEYTQESRHRPIPGVW